MTAFLTKGFLLGLATAPFCVAACAPVFLPAVLAHKGARRWSNFIALAEFLAGRLIAYAAVGALFGWLGASAEGPFLRWAGIIAHALLGIALLLYAVAESGGENAFCRAAQRWGRAGRFPLLLGLLTGVNLCPPFIAAISQVLDAGGIMHGLIFFVSFFAGTSLVALPMLVLAFGNLLPAMRSLGRVACATVGLIFLCAAIRAAMPAETKAPVITMVTPSTAWMQEEMPSASGFAEVDKPVRHFLGESADGKVGIIVFSDDLAPEVRGLHGHVPVGVTINMEGLIQSVRILPHHSETPGYMAMVNRDEFLNQFKGMSYSDPIALGADLDGVTGATWTSKAVADGVRLTARRATEQALSLHTKAPEPEPVAPGLRLAHLAILLLFVVAVIAEARKISWLRHVLLAVSFLYLGLWLKTFFSVRYVFDILTLQLPSFREHAAWYILGLCALGGSLLSGRIYCAYLCPFGALTEFAGRLFGRKARLTPSMDAKARKIKYGVLIALVLAYAAVPAEGLLHVEPFAEAFTLRLSGENATPLLRLAWLGFLGVASIYVFRFFCRYLCPAGAAMAFLARHRLLGRSRPCHCPECGECGVSCPRKGGQP